MPSRSSSSSKSCSSAPPRRTRRWARAASPSRSPTPVIARRKRASMWKGILLACDSQTVVNSSAPRSAAVVDRSRTRRDLPMPGCPTIPTTPPWPAIARSSKPSTVDISHRRPTRFDAARLITGCWSPIPSRRRATTPSGAPLIWTISGSPRSATLSTNRAVDALSSTPPGGATDSIRWAMPTCSPIVV